LPVHVRLTDQANIGLVDQGRSLQRVIGPLLTEIPRGQRMQLPINQRKDSGLDFSITLLPLGEKEAQFRRCWRSAHVLLTVCGDFTICAAWRLLASTQ